MKKISFLFALALGLQIARAQPPTITSFTPNSAKPGDVVTLAGTNFNTTPANNIVFFGATRATVTASSATSATLTVPAGATYAPITLLNTGTSLAAYSRSNFTPTYSPAKTGITASDFAAKVDFAGSNPFSVAIGDLDGDGKPDLAVANYFSATVSIYRNTATSGSISTGSFAAKVDFTTGPNASSVAIGDLDGDGKPDLAVASNTSAFVSVLRNTSTSGSISSGSFAAKLDFATGSGSYSLAIGDLDGDGKPDLAVANIGSNNVSIFRNTATSGNITGSSFAAKVDFATGTNPHSVAIGDLDGDGKPDLATANEISNNVSVLRNTATSGSIGTGSFAAKVDFATGSTPYSVAIGDLDGDGKQDLVTANYNPSTISVLRNTSTSGITTGSFAANVDFATGIGPKSVTIGDLDGDGKPDLAVGNYVQENVSVFRNTATSGSITFASKVDFASGGSVQSVAIGDLDADGRPDLAVANSGINTVAVLRSISNNPDLISLTISAGTLAPSFAAATTTYTASVANETSSITVTPTRADANASIQVRVNGGVYAAVTNGSPSGSLALNVGANTIDVKVTAQDGTTIKTYTITVTRALAVACFTKISAGNAHTVGIKVDGTLWAWGNNLSGQLGNGTNTGQLSPIQIGTANNWAGISAGEYYTMAIKQDGTLWAWGNNFYGQLGDATTVAKTSPIQIGSATNWASVSAGSIHTLAIKTDGTLWAWGNNGDGRLGIGNSIQQTSPVQIGSDNNWQSVETGDEYSLAIKTNGTLWAWGYNGSGQLGIGSYTSVNIPTQAGIATNWRSMSALGSHVVAVRTDGTLWTWGENNLGQLGDGTNVSKNVPTKIGVDVDWDMVSAGNMHSAATKTNGNLWTWGANIEGQLGNGTFNNSNIPVLITTSISKVFAGTAHTLAINSSGPLATWGWNNDGQLGDGTTVSKNVPTSIACPGVPVVSNNADLSAMTISNGTLAPVFASGTIAYTASVTNPTTSITVTPTRAEANATIQARVNGGVYAAVTSGSPSAALNLNVGANTVEVKVTAQDGTTIKTYTITVTREASLLPAQPANALHFDGTNDYVQTTALNGQVLDNFTVEAWVRPNHATNIITFLSTREPNEFTFDAKFADGNKILIDCGNGSNWGAGDGGIRTFNYNYAVGKWVHIAIVYSGTSCTVYANGVSLGTQTTSVLNPMLFNTTSYLKIGSVQGVQFFNGSIDEVRIWNTARTATDIQNNFRDTVARNSAGLVANYRFDNGTAGGTNTGLTTLSNVVGSSLTGTLNNFALTGNTSNWVESYAMVIPTATAATSITATGFTANWTAPLRGTVDNGYRLEVSTLATFNPQIFGSPFTVSSGLASTVTGLLNGITYYYRLTADKISVTGQGGFSNVMSLTTPNPGASSDANLNDLTISSGILDPIFQSFDTTYTANVGFPASSITITPTAAQAIATIQVRVNGGAFATVASGSPSAALNLNVGANTVQVRVTAQNGTTIKTYTITVTRAAVSLPPGNTLHFDGTNDFVVTGALGSIINTNFTVEAWVRPNHATNTLTFISTREPQEFTFDAKLDAGNKITIDCGNGSNSFGNLLNFNYNYTVGKWMHVAIIFNGTSCTVYVNGVNIGTQTNPSIANPTLFANNSVLKIGAVQGLQYFNGNIDEVRLWNIARSQAQIQAAMFDTVATNSPNLFAYYRFDEGAAGGNNAAITALPNLVSAGLNGTLTNLALTGTGSNWVESYAMVVPTAAPATRIFSKAFTAHWNQPLRGIVDSAYLLEVSTSSNFATQIAGSPFSITGGALERTVDGLTPGATYHYRVRADKVSVTGQGGYSNTISGIVLLPATPVYTFTGSGNWSDPANWAGGAPPAILEDNAQIIINPGAPTNECIVDVAVIIPKGATLTVAAGKKLRIPANMAIYPEVTIGTQKWMTRNLDVTRYRNGDPIPQVTDPIQWKNLTTGAWCWYNNDSATYAAIYGRLYNWYAVNDPRGLAPQGWHVPTSAEWDILADFLGGSTVAGGKMKATGTQYWKSPNTDATNSSGFTGLPGGYFNLRGKSVGVGLEGSWWSSTDGGSINGQNRKLSFSDGIITLQYGFKVFGFSVRCLRD